MTKLKSKKMTKSTFAVIIMAIAMVAMLAFGGTYAYFTAQATAKSATATLGKISITTARTSDAAQLTGTFVPGDTILAADSGKFTITNESTAKAYIFIKVSAVGETGVDLSSYLTTSVTTGEQAGDWKAYSETGVYYMIAESAFSDTNVPLEVKLSTTLEDLFVEGEDSDTTTYMGKNITISFEAKAVQFDNVVEVKDPETQAVTKTALQVAYDLVQWHVA